MPCPTISLDELELCFQDGWRPIPEWARFSFKLGWSLYFSRAECTKMIRVIASSPENAGIMAFTAFGAVAKWASLLDWNRCWADCIIDNLPQQGQRFYSARHDNGKFGAFQECSLRREKDRVWVEFGKKAVARQLLSGFLTGHVVRNSKLDKFLMRSSIPVSSLWSSLMATKRLTPMEWCNRMDLAVVMEGPRTSLLQALGSIRIRRKGDGGPTATMTEMLGASGDQSKVGALLLVSNGDNYEDHSLNNVRMHLNLGSIDLIRSEKRRGTLICFPVSREDHIDLGDRIKDWTNVGEDVQLTNLEPIPFGVQVRAFSYQMK